MLCEDCGKRMAQYLLFDPIDNTAKPLCESCLNEYCYYFGEPSLTFVSIDNLEAIIREFNRIIKYWNDRYRQLLEEYDRIKLLKTCTKER